MGDIRCSDYRRWPAFNTPAIVAPKICIRRLNGYHRRPRAMFAVAILAYGPPSIRQLVSPIIVRHLQAKWDN